MRKNSPRQKTNYIKKLILPRGNNYAAMSAIDTMTSIDGKINSSQKYRYVEILGKSEIEQETIIQRIPVIELYKMITTTHHITSCVPKKGLTINAKQSSEIRIYFCDSYREAEKTDHKYCTETNDVIIFAAKFTASVDEINKRIAQLSLDDFINLLPIPIKVNIGADAKFGTFFSGRPYCTKIKNPSRISVLRLILGIDKKENCDPE